MEWIVMLALILISVLAAAIVGGVDDEPRGSVETRFFSKNGYLPLD
jgi:hypothetical protein